MFGLGAGAQVWEEAGAHAPCEACALGSWSSATGAYGFSSGSVCSLCPEGRYGPTTALASEELCKQRLEVAERFAGGMRGYGGGSSSGGWGELLRLGVVVAAGLYVTHA